MSAAPRRGRDIWRRLNGLVCLFKPSGCTVNHCMKVLRHRLTTDLNALEEARFRAAAELPPPGLGVLESCDAAVLEPQGSGVGPVVEPLGSGETGLDRPQSGSRLSSVPELSEQVSLNPRLVTGPAFLPVDVRLMRLASLDRHISGPLLLGVNGGTRLTAALREAGPQLRVYHLTARLGLATDTLLADGKPTERASYGHVTRGKLEAVLSGLQAAHQRHMFEHTGLPVNSQAAYELASQGPLRPARGSPPVLYALHCLQFAPPFVTIEVHGCNESGQYLLTLIDDLGRQLRTAAVTVRARCVRHGPFTLDRALLMKHWRLEHLQKNMRQSMVTAAEGFSAPLSATLQSLGGAERQSSASS